MLLGLGASGQLHRRGYCAVDSCVGRLRQEGSRESGSELLRPDFWAGSVFVCAGTVGLARARTELTDFQDVWPVRP